MEQGPMAHCLVNGCWLQHCAQGYNHSQSVSILLMVLLLAVLAPGSCPRLLSFQSVAILLMVSLMAALAAGLCYLSTTAP
jgi:hypothetical protein